MGQINEGNPKIEEILTRISFDETESPIVRHEGILAFYEIKKDKELL